MGAFDGRKWRRNVPGVISALAAVLLGGLVAACGGGGPASPASGPASQGPMLVDTSTLFSSLSHDIQDKDRAAFLKLVAPAARPAVAMWWDNLAAIGFDNGAIGPENGAFLRADSAGNVTLTVRAGTHSPLDPMDESKAMVPAETYRVGVHFASGAATGEIISWKPLGNAPWDSGTRLYVRKGQRVVVAGYQNDAALVRQTVPLAEAAADYDIRLFNAINSNDLEGVRGFVVFVSGNAQVRERWFRTGPQPKGWSGDGFGGLTFPMPGMDGLTDIIGHGIQGSAVGGGRVVIVPYSQLGETPAAETSVLVHEFVHVILAPSNTGLYADGQDAVPAWTAEGIAVAIERVHDFSSDTKSTWNFHLLTGDIAALPGRFRSGALPTNKQIYNGSAADGKSWYTVAGSVYEYIAIKYGMNQMLASAVLLYSQDTTPFGNVLRRTNSDGSYTYYPASTIRNGWRSWLSSPPFS